MSESLISLLILLPLIGSVVLYLTPNKINPFIIFPISIFLIIDISFLIYLFKTPINLHIGSWQKPLGIELFVDSTSLIFLLITSIVAFFISIYSYITNIESRFWIVWFILIAGLNTLFMSSDIFNFYVIFEIIGLSSVILITLNREVEALKASMNYLLVTFLASMSYLLAVALIYAVSANLDIYSLKEILKDSSVATIAFSFITLALIAKTALFPLHFWLPKAHSNALTPVSAILSAIILKASFYILFRFWIEVFDENFKLVVGEFLAILGIFAILWGSIFAIRESSLKLMVAYSTIAQVGYLFITFTLMQYLEGINGAIFQVISHLSAKSALFLLVGIIILATDSKRVEDIKGVGYRYPIVIFSIGVVGVSLIGLPISGGFIAKWLLIEASIKSGAWHLVVALILGGLLTAGYIFKILNYALTKSSSHKEFNEVSKIILISTFLLSLTSLFIGIFGMYIFKFIVI